MDTRPNVATILHQHSLWRADPDTGRRADLIGADLGGADLRRADLSGADLRRAGLPEADLSFADLIGADLSWANLRQANLYEADLHKATLRGADLNGTDLSWANLSGANLTATCLDPTNIPNGQADGYEHEGEYIIGYRTACSPYLGGPGYQPGQAYEAPIFSTSDTECHPGLYSQPTPKGLGGPLIKVWARPEETHKAGTKYRHKRFYRVEAFDRGLYLTAIRSRIQSS